MGSRAYPGWRTQLMSKRTTLFSALALASLLLAGIPARAQFGAAAAPSVKDEDNPARQPVQFNSFVTFAAGQQFATVSPPFVVPAHKRLVIEMVTGEIFVPTGQEVRVTLVTTAAGNFSPNHKLTFGT